MSLNNLRLMQIIQVKHFGEFIYILMVWFSMYSMYNEGIIKHLKLIKYVWLNNKESEINKIHMTDHI